MSDDGLFGTLSDEKMKGPNVHEKEDEYNSKMLYPVGMMKFFLGLFSVFGIFFYWFFEIRGFAGFHFPIISYFFLLPLFILSLIFIHPCPVDIWVPHIAASRIGSSYCKVGWRVLTLDYDLLNSKKDIMKFIDEITDKSEDFNYFLHGISASGMKIKLKVRIKVKIPDKANFDKKYQEEEDWNYIPLGICLTERSTLGTVNWMLNDQNKVKGDFRETIPSTSFLVAGGTGSGKSVLENNIIRHVNKFNENFQAMLVDVKRVEFGGLSDNEGIKAVALDIQEAKGCLEASREIMYSRFKFMEAAGVNNVYKLNDYKCSYFLIKSKVGNERLYQFDEIFYSKCNGEVLITTIDDLYKKSKEGSEIEIFFSGQKEKALKITADLDNFNSSNDKLFIREIFAGENYYINNVIYNKNDILNTSNGQMSCEELYDNIYDKNKTISVDGISINKDNCKIIECIFKPKAILTVVDEMSEVMSTNDYKAQSSISDSISSIARLGRAAACHLCLAPLPEDLEISVIQDRKRSFNIVNDYIKNMKNKIEGKEYNLPNYFENLTDREIKDHINYTTMVLSVIENVLILNETDKVELNIRWEELSLGDIIDDSVVIYIGDWSEEQCYKLIAEDCSSIEASSTHLFKVNVYRDDKIINNEFELSGNIRSKLKETDDCWICVEDIISSIDNGLNVFLDCGSQIISYKKTDIKNVRCIQTTKGEYAIEGR